jgi:hypothetical protein
VTRRRLRKLSGADKAKIKTYCEINQVSEEVNQAGTDAGGFANGSKHKLT